MNFRQSYNVVQNPLQMILLCEKGVHGDSVRCEQVCSNFDEPGHEYNQATYQFSLRFCPWAKLTDQTATAVLI